MDPQKTPTFSEDLSTIVSQLPAPVQEFFASGKIDVIAKDLMQKYQFHIDQGTVVEREIITLLLGLKNPDEFTQALEEAQLDQRTINGIIQDVNDQIFMPLQAKMMSARSGKSGGENIQHPVKPAMPSAAPQTAPQPTGVEGPPPQSPSYFHLENKIPITRPAQGTLNTGRQPTPGPIRPGERSSLRDVLAAVTAPKPLDNSKLLEDHEEPHIEFPPLRPAPPRTTPPPPNLPGALPPKSYSADPYREPIDEK